MTLEQPFVTLPKMPPLEQELLHLIYYVYNLIQWPGVVVLMAIESACIPLPSELIMPLAGWMLIREQSLPVAHIMAAGAYGALGCCIGSIIAYVVGMKGGRPFLEKYGRYILISRQDLDSAERDAERNSQGETKSGTLKPCRIGTIGFFKFHHYPKC